MIPLAPLLLRPYLRSIRNRWRHERHIRGGSGRDIILLLFAVGVMFATFRGTSLLLAKFEQLSVLGYLSPGYPLGLIFLFLSGMTLLSTVALSFGLLYLADDLEVVLKSPLSTWRLFWGKFVTILVAESWMPFVFIYPLLAAFANHYHTAASFYFLSAAIILPFFIIAAALGMLAATMFAALVPANRTRELLAAAVAVAFFGLYALAELILSRTSDLRDASQIMRLISSASMQRSLVLPSSWIGGYLDSILLNIPGQSYWYLVLTWSTAVALAALAYLAIHFLHFRGYSQARNHRNRRRYNKSFFARLGATITSFLPSQARAISTKEFRSLFRDITQVAQFVMLAGIATVYVYNLRLVSALDQLPPESVVWWRGLLFLINICLGAFVSTAVCTRFIFPSVSIEGRAFWILRAAPIDLAALLRLKFQSWIVPVTLITAAVFTLGAYAIGANFGIVLLSFYLSICMAFGIVGLALGLGALFADFTIESPSQLAAGLGSLTFMLSSTILIFLSVAPVWALLETISEIEKCGLDAGAIRFGYLAANLVFMAASNIAISTWALRRGARTLSGLQ